VTDSLAVIDPDEINDLLEKLFKWAMKSKIFYNHMETLLPDFYYHLACDGVWVHKYTHPHAKTEWLSSIRVFKGNCFILAKLGRMRADHEDLHNTLKNRGFAAKHD
jgi:hypothetical protein